MLSNDDFRRVVDSTPLISVDLVVEDPDGKILLGKRVNRPACGFWFVPGGRILKNESIGSAFRRLVLAELGLSMDIGQASYLGLYEHFYDDSAMSDKISTHYVVNAFLIKLKHSMNELPHEQHSEYRWFSQNELLADESVHDHSKWYIMNEKGYSA